MRLLVLVSLSAVTAFGAASAESVGAVGQSVPPRDAFSISHARASLDPRTVIRPAKFTLTSLSGEIVVRNKPEEQAPEPTSADEGDTEVGSRTMPKIGAKNSQALVDVVDGVLKGDQEKAAEAADDYVEYLKNLAFTIREVTTHVMQAMVRKGEVSEEQGVQAVDYLDYKVALRREEDFSPYRIMHKDAMKRIKPDTKGEAEVYFFFTLNSTYSRQMTPDVERLFQALKAEFPKVKVGAFSIGAVPTEWANSFRDYTGLTLPIVDGSELAREFQIGFAPALVVVAPNTKQAYKKAGQQSFERMYEFVRTVQGKSIELTPALKQLIDRPIGTEERLRAEKVVEGTQAPSALKLKLASLRASQEARRKELEGIN